MLKGNLKDDLLGLKNQLDMLEKEIEVSPATETKPEEKKEVKKYHNTEEKLNQLLEKDKVINLNIGGRVFKTTLSTVNSFENSLFAQEYNNIRDSNTNEIFFDRSFNNFQLILNFLREKTLSMKKLSKFEKEDLKVELDYYGLTEHLNTNKLTEVDLKWDAQSSKEGAFTIDTRDPKILEVRGNSCYTHYVTNKVWKDESFKAEFEFNVQHGNTYLYFGIVNENYNFQSHCLCTSPPNAFYMYPNGNIKDSVTTHNFPNMAFGSQRVVLGIKVNLQEKKITFYKNGDEAGPLSITGNSFRIIAGNCDTATGTITILSCNEGDQE